MCRQSKNSYLALAVLGGQRLTEKQGLLLAEKQEPLSAEEVVKLFELEPFVYKIQMIKIVR